jgi:hypothetical protein
MPKTEFQILIFEISSVRHKTRKCELRHETLLDGK